MNAYRNQKVALLYVLPAAALVLVFIFIPILLNFYYSLYRWSGFSDTHVFVGLDYYVRLAKDPVFYTALGNNVLYAIISLVFQVGGGLVLAAILEEKLVRRMQPFFRTVFFLPSVISIAVVGLMWQFIYNPDVGLVNGALRGVGLADWVHAWLGDSQTAIYAVIAVSQWQYTGYIMLLFLLAMHKIPVELYEQASIDGAGGWRRFWHITVPQVKEMLLVTATITVIGAFKVFDEVYIMTAGGPGRSTEVLGTMLYRAAFRNDEMGYATTIATVVFLITFILSYVQIKLSKTGQES
ncbi:sugar ABC transporter permease [Brevibacillus fluminis]|uniref:Sugar ABC transporter permease n=1 Tax=Brevibacillus fluminis TaxID=511487 RepID=A0A3M8DJ62_9BACL|nr:sugar ABC transporter permease [Brevibacillus fluminis]RNB87167.1 sugar ABC transporter permease [Brevibacillus fluminis]